jgi:hypothetical protein
MSQFVRQLSDKFRHLVARETIFEWCGIAMTGQFEKVDAEPLRHELRQCAPVLELRNCSWDDDERLAFSGFHHMQARKRQVDEIGLAG